MADIDGDGRLDLVTGSDDCCDAKPGFHWFRRGADGRFVARGEVLVRVAGSQAGPREGEIERFRMRVRLADWDGDGRLDVLAVDTRSKGRIALSRGPWDAKPAVDATAEVEGSPPTAEVNTQPVVVDWDGDGRLDLITATFGTPGVQWYPPCRIWWQRNEGTPDAPRLGQRRLLTSFENYGVHVGLDAADLDGTGLPGLLLAAELPPPVQGGHYRTAVWYYPRRPEPG